jgi:hypothetical protein
MEMDAAHLKRYLRINYGNAMGYIEAAWHCMATRLTCLGQEGCDLFSGWYQFEFRVLPVLIYVNSFPGNLEILKNG